MKIKKLPFVWVTLVTTVISTFFSVPVFADSPSAGDTQEAEVSYTVEENGWTWSVPAAQTFTDSQLETNGNVTIEPATQDGAILLADGTKIKVSLKETTNGFRLVNNGASDNISYTAALTSGGTALTSGADVLIYTAGTDAASGKSQTVFFYTTTEDLKKAKTSGSYSDTVTFELNIEESGETPVSENVLSFTLLKDGTYSVSAGPDIETAAYVEIPSTYNGVAVTQIAELAFYKVAKNATISVPDSITVIGESAFCSTQNIDWNVVGDTYWRVMRSLSSGNVIYKWDELDKKYVYGSYVGACTVGLVSVLIREGVNVNEIFNGKYRSDGMSKIITCTNKNYVGYYAEASGRVGSYKLVRE